MIKRLWEKLAAWLKDIPVPLVLAGLFMMSLLLGFVAKGTLVLTDWIVGYLFTIIIVVAVWKIGKNRKG